MESIFLGNDKPLLHLTADYLIKTLGKPNRLDMRNVILTFQEQRAINRLEEILAERSEEIDPAWYPPEFLTIGALPEKLYELKYDLASDLTQCFAWLDAVDQLNVENPDLLHRLIVALPQSDDLDSRIPLGKMFAKLHRELAADTLDFIHVANICRKLNIETESLRWEALDKLQKKYLAKLDSLHIWDVQSARIFALEHSEEFEPKRRQFDKDNTKILLVGVADMNLAQKSILREFRKYVTPLVFAPKSDAERFDDLGCLNPSVWQNVPISLSDDQIHIVESAQKQAEEVIRCLAQLKGAFAPPEIVIGVPDKQIIPFIEQQFEHAGIASRIVAGKSIRQSSIYRFLETLLPFLETPTFANFATLIRHPEVESWLQKTLPNTPNLVVQFDKYHTDYLPIDYTSLEHSKPLQAVWQQLKILIDTQDLKSLLQTIFVKHEDDSAYLQVSEILEQIEKIKPELLPKQFKFTDKVRLVLQQTANVLLTVPHEPKAVEMLGWLDLAMDDAEVVIVTGMNDGTVPAFQTSDIFLPDRIRQHLNIEDNSRRYARDAYALTCLLATRQHNPQRVQLICSRRSVQGDPMLPSRLFFATEKKTIAERVLNFFGEHRETPPQVHFANKVKETVTFPLPEIPKHAGENIHVMSVTEFAAYKRCPYRYYLQFQYKLKVLNDQLTELNAMSFGSLVHDVLDVFGKTKELNRSTSAEQIRVFLVQQLRNIVNRKFGEKPRPVIAIQAERAIKRLETFAGWQANWAKNYEILETELQFNEDQFSLDVDGKTMGLRGRIDRIDRNKRTNALAIWDYKTGKSKPNEVHRTKSGDWLDFQLPLYYHLLSQHAEYKEMLKHDFIEGYILLPADTSATGDKQTNWDRETVLSGIEEARNIVRCIWNNEFPKTEPAPSFSEAFAAICGDY